MKKMLHTIYPARLFVFLLAGIFLLNVNTAKGQVINESFDENVWSAATNTNSAGSTIVVTSAASTSGTLVVNSGSWIYSKASRVTGATNSKTIHTASNSFMIGSSSGYIITPNITAGVATITFWAAPNSTGANALVIAANTSNVTTAWASSQTFTGSGTASWTQITYTGYAGNAANFRLQLTNTSGTAYFIDDIVIVQDNMNLTTLGTAATQDFNSMTNGPTSAVGSGFRIANGNATDWSTGTLYTTLAGGTAAAVGTGACYNYGDGAATNQSTTDRAVGFLASGGFAGDRSIILHMKNNTGSTITQLAVAFDYEKYRNGTNAAGCQMTFFYGSDGSTWTSNTSGDNNYSADANNNAVSPATSTSKSFNITGLSISNGSDYYFRWTYNVAAGTNAQGIGIDNVSITPSAAVPSVAISSNSPAAGNLVKSTTTQTLWGSQLVVTSANTTLTGVTVNTTNTDTYAASAATDFTNFKLLINTTNSTGGATQLGSTITNAPTHGGSLAFTTGTNLPYAVTTGTGTYYVFLVADVPSGATSGATLTIASTAFTNITIGSGSKTGTDPVAAAGTQTIIAAPTVTTNAASSITTSGFILNGTVNANANSTTASFDYGLTTGYTSGNVAADQSPVTGTSNTAITKTISLSNVSNTLYHFRAKGVNAAGTTNGSDATVTTLSNAPTVGTGSSPTATGFTANWTAPTNDGSEAYTYTVEADDDNTFASVNATGSGITSGTLLYTFTTLSPGVTYYYRVKAVNAGGSSAWSSVSAGITTTSSTVPTISTVTATSITINSAASGGNSITDGGDAITHKGVVWDASANPTIALSTKTDDGTGTANFSSSITSLSANTTYHYRAYATNSIGTSYGSDLSFTTLEVEPTTVGSVTFGTRTATSLVVNFTSGNGGRRVVFVKQGTAVSYTPTDGTSPSGVDASFGSGTQFGTGNYAVYDGTGNTVTVTGLSANTTYYVAVYEYNNNSVGLPNYYATAGTGNQTTYNPTISTGSLSGFGNVVTGTNSAPQNYTVTGSELVSNISVTPPAGFQIATMADFSDAVTNPSSLTLTKDGSDAVLNTIYVRYSPSSANGATGSLNITHSATSVTTQNVAVSGNAIATEPTSISTITFGTVSSTSIPVNLTAIGNGSNRIIVIRASNAVSFTPPSDGVAISGTVSNVFTTATDQGSGNKIIYQGSGPVASPFVTVTGLSANTTYYFAVYEYNVGTGTSQNYLTSSSATGNQATTYTSSASDYFRSNVTSGDWATAGTWQSSPDNSNWYTATVAPGTTAANVEIQPGHTIAITSAVTTNSITIDYSGSAGELDINSNTLTINSGKTVTVNGILKLAGGTYTITGSTTNVDGTNAAFTYASGTLTGASATTLLFKNGATYNHQANGGNIPTANWTGTGASTVNVTGVVATAPGGLNQTFSNLKWNNTGQTATGVIFGNTGFSVTGNMNIVSTGSAGTIQLTSGSGVAAMTVGSYTQSGGVVFIFATSGRSLTTNGDFSLSGGTFYVSQNGQGTATSGVSLNIKGNLSHTAGTLSNTVTSSTSAVTFNGTGGGQTADFSGTVSGLSVTVNNSSGVSLNSNLTVGTTLTLTSGTLTVGSHTLTLAGGNISRTSGNIDASNASATVSFSGSSAQTIAASTFTGNVNSLTINNSSGVTLSQAITLANTLTLTAGTFTNSTNLTLSTGATIVRSAGTLNSVPTFGTTVNVTYNNTGTLNSGNELPSTTTVLNNLTINNSATLTLGASRTVNGTLNLQAGTIATGAFALTIPGSISRTSGSIDASNASATVTLNGSSGQTIPASTFTGNVNNLTLTNSSTSGVILNQAISIAGNLTLNLTGASGNVFTTNGNLTMASGSTITRTLGTLSAAPTFGGTVNVTYNNTSTLSTDVELPTSTGNVLATLTVSGSGLVNIANDATVNTRFSIAATSAAAINSGKKLTLVGSVATSNSNPILHLNTGGTLHVNGTLTNTSTGTSNPAGTVTGTININSGAVYENARNAGTIPTATWDGNSTLLITGTVGTAPTLGGQSFGNVTWNCSGQTANAQLSGGLTSVSGTLDIQNSNSFEVRLVTTTSPNISIANINVSGTNGVAKLALSSSSGTPVIAVTGNVIVASGCTLDAGSVASPISGNGGTLLVFGSITINGTFRTANANGFSGSSSTSIINSPTLTLGTSSTVEYYATSGSQAVDTRTDYANLTITGSGVKNLSGNITLANANNTLLINSSGVLNAGTNIISFGSSTSPVVTINGTLQTSNTVGLNGASNTTIANTNSPTITLGAASTIDYNAAVAQPITARTDYANLTTSGSGAKTLGGAVIASGNITIGTGTTLDVSNGNNYALTIGGNWSNSGTFTARNGTVTFNGTGTQSIANTAGENFYVLTENKSAGTLSLSNAVAVTSLLNITLGTFDLSNSNLTLKSTSISNTALMGTVGGTIAYSGTGRFTTERYINNIGSGTGYRGYRTYTSPVYTDSSIWKNWQEGGVNTNNNGTLKYGTHITGITPAASGQAAGTNHGTSGLDVTTTGSASLWTYNYKYTGTSNNTISFASDDGFYTITNTKNKPLIPYVGYFIIVRGDRTYNLTNSSAPSVFPFILRSTGKLLAGPVTINNTNTTYYFDGGTTPQTDNNFKLNTTTGNNNLGFSLIGNPYMTPINWNTIYTASTNISPYYWVWDQAIGGGSGGYCQMDDMGNQVGTSNNNGYIQPGQAFFIQNDNVNSNPSLVITEAAKSTTNSNLVSVFGVNAPVYKLRFSLQKAISGKATEMDGALALFSSDYTNTVNSADGIKLSNTVENMCIFRNNDSLGIERRFTPVITDTINLRMWGIVTSPATNYTLKVITKEFIYPSLKTYVWDRYLNTKTLVTSDTTSVTFTPTTTVTTYKDRFSVVFGSTAPLPVSIIDAKAYQQNNVNIVDWTTSGEATENVVKYEVERSATSTSFITIGTVASLNNAGNSSYTFTDVAPLTGDNYYRIKIVTANGNIKYSQVMVVRAKNNLSITVYPNPVFKGGNITVQLSGVSSGMYQVELYNIQGQQVLVKPIQHNGGSASYNMQLNTTLAAGTYRLKIVSANNEGIFNQTIQVQ